MIFFLQIFGRKNFKIVYAQALKRPERHSVSDFAKVPNSPKAKNMKVSSHFLYIYVSP